MNNTKLKELGLWIEPSSDILFVRERLKKLHRLFNPKDVKLEKDERTIKYLEFRDTIKKSKRSQDVSKLLDFLKDNNIPIKEVKIKTHKPRFAKHLGKKTKKLHSLKSSKPSIYDANRILMIKLGYTPKISRSKLRKLERQAQRQLNKIGKPGTCKQRRLQKRKDEGKSYRWLEPKSKIA